MAAVLAPLWREEILRTKRLSASGVQQQHTVEGSLLLTTRSPSLPSRHAPHFSSSKKEVGETPHGKAGLVWVRLVVGK